MDHTALFAALPGALLPWYEENRRDLPWRADREPYHIWLSEIMLQQTRVEAVKGYYARFLDALPGVEDLASCDDDRLHKLWEGLGYYSRVRNLKKAAQLLMEQYDGTFPRDYQAIRNLPGIGDYTAGAICSIAFDLPTPAVDGNVLRLAARLTDDHRSVDTPEMKREVRDTLATVYPARAGDFTQALMELGATLCGPNRPPECGVCPALTLCLGYRNKTAPTLPIRSPKREKRHEDRTVFILSCSGAYALEKRPARGLLAGLWQFPNVSGFLSTEEAIQTLSQMGLQPREPRMELSRKHIFTHIQWDMKGIYIEVAAPGGGFVWLTREQIRTQAALPTAFRQFFEELDHV
ncbi:MAG: A/G-specific adenine glycosylase [Faecousia sp.]